MKRPHLKHILDMVSGAPCMKPPPPWKVLGSHAIGGLEAVGFERDSDLLLVVSSQGSGVFDCTTGKRVARSDETEYYDTSNLEASGIGPLSGRRIRMSGLQGGALARQTIDGWCVESLVLEWPIESLVLTPPQSSIYGKLSNQPHHFTKVYEDSEIRAWGFSPTGRTLLLAVSSDITIFGRDMVPQGPTP